MQPCKIFLSHRFADKKIADVVRHHFKQWGFDTDCYQASAPGTGPMAGDFITEELKTALYHARLFVLIYTFNDYDWSFCMWECGLATHPTKTNTRTIVLQCNPNDTPRLFEGQQVIKMNYDDLKNFILQLFLEDNFLPGEGPHRPTADEEMVNRFTENFYKELRDVVPLGQREDRFRWDFLTLQLTQAAIGEFQKSREGDSEYGVSFVHDKCRAIGAFGEALKHFGYADLETDLTLAKLLNRWTTSSGGGKNESEWIGALASEILRAIDNAPADPQWRLMRSATHRNSQFFPVVNHVRLLPDGSMEFDVYFYRSQDV